MYKELFDNYEPVCIASGNAQNSSRVTQWMVKSPGATSYMGCIGRDDFGDTLKHCISADGVNTHFLEESTKSTGTCATVSRPTGERALVANLAAAAHMSVEHLLTEKAQEFIAAAKFIYIPAFLLTDNLPVLLHLGQRAVDEDKTFMLNLSAVYIVEYFMDDLMATLPLCDFVFCNDAECLAFGEMKGWPLEIPLVALKLAGLPKASGTRPRVIIVTSGGGSTVVASHGKVATYPVEDLPNELLIDINGAGDAFVGGFVSKLVLEEKLGNCVRAGHWAARTVIQHPGCTFPKVCDYV